MDCVFLVKTKKNSNAFFPPKEIIFKNNICKGLAKTFVPCYSQFISAGPQSYSTISPSRLLVLCSESPLTPWLIRINIPGIKLRGRWVREPPADDGSIRTGADEGPVVGADLDAGDAAAVRRSDVGDRTIQVVPHLHQFVITTCHAPKHLHLAFW